MIRARVDRGSYGLPTGAFGVGQEGWLIQRVRPKNTNNNASPARVM